MSHLKIYKKEAPLTDQQRREIELLAVHKMSADILAIPNTRFYNSFNDGTGIYTVGLVNEQDKVIYETTVRYEATVAKEDAPKIIKLEIDNYIALSVGGELLIENSEGHKVLVKLLGIQEYSLLENIFNLTVSIPTNSVSNQNSNQIQVNLP